MESEELYSMKAYNMKKGVTLIEVLFVLGISAILLGVVYLYYAHAYSQQKTVAAREEFLSIRDAIQELYSNQTLEVWGTLNNETITKSGLLSKKYTGADGSDNAWGTNLINPWGGPIVVYNVDNGDLSQSYFQIVFYDVPKEDCVLLASNHDWMNGGPATQINNYQDNSITPLDISFIANNVCVYQNNMFAWATVDG